LTTKRQHPKNGSLSELFWFEVTTTTMINTFLTDNSAPTVFIGLAIALSVLLN
jgi:hypothetical protein